MDLTLKDALRATLSGLMEGKKINYVLCLIYNKRGVMVDPPPFSTQKLKRMGIPSRLIDSVIISHCHGDHDAAVFQKVLDTHKVEVKFPLLAW